MRTLGRLGPLSVDLNEPRPAAVSWNSMYVRDAAPPPRAFEIVHEAVIHPANARMADLARVSRTPRANQVLFVGRLEESKGAWVLVEALGILARDHGLRVALHVVGDGTAAQRDELHRRASAAGVADQVETTGPLSGDAFLDEVARASVWSVPSVWAEPAGMTGVEAALARVPLVLSRVGGIPELFSEGTQALFHDRGDAAGCAEAIACTLAGGVEVEARVAAAFARGRELSYEPYLRAMDAFFDAGLRALRSTEAPPSVEA